MGLPVPFVELPLPAEDSSFAAAMAKAGCDGDMMGCPDRTGGHRLAWIAEGVDGHKVAALETSLKQVYDAVETVELDLPRGRWIATGTLKDEGLKSPAIDAYIDIEDRFEAPWINVERGLASLRLLPRSDMELFVDLGRLKKALEPRKVPDEPMIRHYQLVRYNRLRDTLRQAVLDEACRDL